MSIFDANSGLNPIPWLQEKTLRALEDAARLADLANEPDTTEWYARNLRAHALALVSRLAPVVALLHQAGEEAASQDAWQPIVDRGSFALARWCNTYGVGDPVTAHFDLLAKERAEGESEAKADVAEREALSADDERGMHLRLELYGVLTRRIVWEDLADDGRRLLLWLLAGLWLSEHADIVTVRRSFLPTDIGASAEATAAAYRELVERGLVERVEGLPDQVADALALRLVVRGLNDGKHALPYEPVEFGYAGATIAGRRTWPATLYMLLPSRLMEGDSRRLRDGHRRCGSAAPRSVMAIAA